MKKLFFLLFCFFAFYSLQAQKCIDYIVLKIENSEHLSDTVFCKILSEDDTDIIIDNGNSITSLSKKNILSHEKCARLMTAFEIYKFDGLDNVTNNLFDNSNTVGLYLRKAAFDTYLSTGLAIVGAGTLTIGFTLINPHTIGRTACCIGGGIVMATSLFFAIRAWNNVYKAGKLFDLNANTALYISPSEQGIGLSLIF